MSNVSQRLTCRYALLRFIPDSVRQEMINVGVVLECADLGIVRCAFGPEARARSFSADFDARIFRAITADITEWAQGVATQLSLLNPVLPMDAAAWRLESLCQSYSGQYTFSELRVILVEDMTETLEWLRKQFVDVPAAAIRPDALNVHVTQFRREVRRTFRQRGLLNQGKLVERLPIQGRRLGQLHFDFGYHNGHITLLHSLWVSSEKRIKAIERAARFEFRIRDVRALYPSLRPYALLGIPTDAPDVDDLRRELIDVQDLMEEQKIIVIWRDQIDQFASELEHDLFSPTLEAR